MFRKDKNAAAAIPFDEAEFERLYRRRAAPSAALVSAFHTMPRDNELALKVLNRVRADAETSPGGLLAMFAIALSAFALMATIVLTVTADSSALDWKVGFGTVMVLVTVAFTVGGVWLYVLQSSRHRCAHMWKGALEAP